MRYLLALVFPPLAVLLCGKPFQSILNFFLTLLFYFPGALHAILVVSSSNAERRHKEQMEAIKEQTKALAKALAKQPAAAVAAVAPASKPTRPKPVAAPAPAPAPVQEDVFVAAPKEPLFEMLKESLASTKGAAIAAYQDLPEWAQPITWGLSAGSLVSVAVVAFLLLRHA